MGVLFGTDGIRGTANAYPITVETAVRVGRAVAHLCKRGRGRRRIVIGKDTRCSGYMLEHALAAGICSMGVDALLTGVLPTPGIAFITTNLSADAGVVVSASHNPFYDNGIKIFSRDGLKLPDAQEAAIERLVLTRRADTLRSAVRRMGRVVRIDDAEGRYITFLKQAVPAGFSLDGMRVVLDCAYGAAFRIAPLLFRELGAEVIALNTTPTGENINDHCGALHPEQAARAVTTARADLGLAFDGDADRLIACDERGAILTGDHLLAVFARALKKQHRLPNNTVVSTVMSNLGLTVALKKTGIRLRRCAVGDRYVMEELVRRGAMLGGESSGHIIIRDRHTTGDGLLAALTLAEALRASGAPLSRLAAVMTAFPQHVINIPVARTPDLRAEPIIIAAVRRAERTLGRRGRVLVRYSGTQRLCRVMVEGPTAAQTRRLAETLAAVIADRLGA